MAKTGTALKKVRREKNITLDVLYVLTGRRLSQSRLSKIERCIFIATPNDKKLLSRALKTPIHVLFPDNETT